MMRIATAAVLAAGIVALAGCTDSREINALTGGLVGAAAGSQVGGGSGRTAAMLGGAAVGTVVGANAPTR
jgi:outer membrane lipoprotein SlyB